MWQERLRVKAGQWSEISLLGRLGLYSSDQDIMRGPLFILLGGFSIHFGVVSSRKTSPNSLPLLDIHLPVLF